MQAWFWNLDRNNRSLLAVELQEGRLRQGWGYDQSLDLRKIRELRTSGKSLDPKQERAWSRCSPMLERIELGDLVAVKAVPERGFTLVEVVGGYDFDLLEVGDYGHVLRINVVGEFLYDAKEVPTRMAAALRRAQHPIRRTVQHRESVLALREVSSALTPDTLRDKLSRWREELANQLAGMARRELKWREFEELVGLLLQHDGYAADWTAGPSEQGADYVAEVGNPYGLDFRIAVQVKWHEGTTSGAEGIDQLGRAFGREGVEAGLFVSSADDLGEEVERELNALKKRRPVAGLYGGDLWDRVLELVAARPERGEAEV